MSERALALIGRFAMVLVFGLLTLTVFDDNSLSAVFFVTVVISVVNYGVGDLHIFPRFGNTVASVGGGTMAALVAYFASLLVVGFRTTLATLIAFALLVVVGESLFHRHLRKTP